MDKYTAERLAQATYNINVVQKRSNEEMYETKILPEIEQTIIMLGKKYKAIETSYKVGKFNQQEYCQALLDLKNNLISDCNRIKLKCRDIGKISIFDSRFMILIEKIDVALSRFDENFKI